MSDRSWYFALTDVEVFDALIQYVKKGRGVDVPVSGDDLLHYITHRNGDRFSVEIFCTPKSPEPTHEPFRWPWQKRPAPAPSPQGETG